MDNDLMVIKGVKYYPICSWEHNQHKLYNAIDKAHNLIYDIEDGSNNSDIDLAYEWLEQCQNALGKFDSYPRRNGVVFAPYNDYKLIKSVLMTYGRAVSL